MRATDVQRLYLQEAAKLFRGQDADTDWTLRAWEEILDGLEQDPLALDHRLDWAAKRRTLEMFIEAENVWWEDERLRSLDLEYHNVDPDLGLYQALEAGGNVGRVAHGELLLAVAAAHLANDYEPGVEPNAYCHSSPVLRFQTGIQWCHGFDKL